MKRILPGSAALMTMIGIANAADLPPAQIPAKAPAVVSAPTFDWTGFYVGGFYGNSINHATASTPGTGGGALPGAVGVADGGWSGGATAGYNWQFSPLWLVGIEGEFGYLGGSRLFQEWDDFISVGEKSKWYGTARGRVGYVAGPALLYVTGGVAFVNVTDTFGGSAATGLQPTSSTTTTVGGTFGAGIEVKLSKNWSAVTEYQYIDGGGTHSFASNSLGGGATANVQHNFQIIKTGMNYRLGDGWDGLPFLTSQQYPSTHNWTGFYLGGNAGIGTSLTQTYSINGDEDLTGTGGVGGGQIGYNYLVWNKYLVGVEGDFGAFSSKRTINDWFDTGFGVFSQKTDWYGTARLRAGTTTGPALLYATGGMAWVHLQDGFTGTPTVVNTRTGSGWTFGGGAEVALDAHWSAKLESLYINAGSSPTINLSPGFQTTFKDRFAIVRAGLNYALN